MNSFQDLLVKFCHICFFSVALTDVYSKIYLDLYLNYSNMHFTEHSQMVGSYNSSISSKENINTDHKFKRRYNCK